jgi:hypothetical protein
MKLALSSLRKLKNINKKIVIKINEYKNNLSKEIKLIFVLSAYAIKKVAVIEINADREENNNIKERDRIKKKIFK